MRIYDLMGRCNESQRRYHEALSTYRNALKDVLGREREIRTVARDREILVSRVLKLQRKRPSEEDPGWDVRMQDAQKELAACESVLRTELASLAAVKRSIFRDALSMRLRAFRELGQMFDSVGAEGLAHLEVLGTPAAMPSHYGPSDPRARRERVLTQGATDSFRSPTVSPPMSVLSLPDSLSQQQSVDEDVDHEAYSDDEELDDAAQPVQMKRQSSQDTARPASPPPLQRANPPPLQRVDSGSRPRPASALVQRASSPPPAPRPTSYGGPTAFPRAPSPVVSRAASPGPRVPGAFSIPSADAHRARTAELKRDEPDSSDEEDARLKAMQVERHEGGGAARLRRRRDSEPTPNRPAKSSGGGGGGGGFFSGFFSVFRGGGKKRDADDDSLRNARRAASTPSWTTRTDHNLKGLGKLRRSDSSDEESPRQFVKVINTGNPQQRLRLGDDGPKPKIVQPAAPKARPNAIRRSSVLSDPGLSRKLGGGGGGGAQTPLANGSASLSRSGTVKSATSEATVKRKKRKPKPRAVQQAMQPSGGGDAPSIMSLVDDDKKPDVPSVPALPALATNAAETASLLSVGSDTAPSRAYGEGGPPPQPGHLAPPAPALKSSVGSDGSRPDSSLSKRKSVRLADDAKTADAEYANHVPAGPPEGAKKLTPPAPSSGWTSRERQHEASSDEEGDGGEYAKARKAMARADRHIKEAGSPAAKKGKARAANQDA